MASCPRNLSFKQFIILIISYYIFVVHSGNVQQIGPTKIGLNTQQRENQVKKKGRFCLQITTAQIGLTTQERQRHVKKKKKEKVFPSDNNSPNRIDQPRETEPGEKKSEGSTF